MVCTMIHGDDEYDDAIYNDKTMTMGRLFIYVYSVSHTDNLLHFFIAMVVIVVVTTTIGIAPSIVKTVAVMTTTPNINLIPIPDYTSSSAFLIPSLQGGHIHPSVRLLIAADTDVLRLQLDLLYQLYRQRL